MSQNYAFEMFLAPQDMSRFVDEYLQIATERGGLSPVAFHRDRFGSQDRCTIAGSERRRFWVWNFDGWEVWVNNFKGVSIEATKDLSNQKAWRVWEEYKRRIGAGAQEEV